MYLSIRVTRFYMKVVGFWYPENQREQRIQNAIQLYTIAAVLFGIPVLVVDLYYSWGDFQAVTDNICVTLPLVVITVKVTICLYERDAVIGLLKFTEKNFWRATYDEYGNKVMKECERKGVVVVGLFSFVVQGALSSYIIKPMFENIGKNGTDRVLPFKLWVDLPTQVTPYFEIFFVIQCLSTIHSGICFFCLDNLMAVLSIHVVGQFKILQRRIENLCEEYVNIMENKKQLSSNYKSRIENRRNEVIHVKLTSQMQDDFVEHQLEQKLFDIAKRTYAELQECVKQHLVLIDYVGQLEYIFNIVVLCQMGTSSILICLAGFQCFLAKQGIFIFHLISVSFQILLFTWTCNEIFINSLEVGQAAFRSRWYMLPNTGAGRAFRQGLVLVILRAQRGCYITAGKFTPISLRSFTGIISTTLSYLSLLRQISEQV